MDSNPKAVLKHLKYSKSQHAQKFLCPYKQTISMFQHVTVPTYMKKSMSKHTQKFSKSKHTQKISMSKHTQKCQSPYIQEKSMSKTHKNFQSPNTPNNFQSPNIPRNVKVPTYPKKLKSIQAQNFQCSNTPEMLKSLHT